MNFYHARTLRSVQQQPCEGGGWGLGSGRRGRGLRVRGAQYADWVLGLPAAILSYHQQYSDRLN